MTTRYASDQNKVVMKFESGTYAGSISVVGNATDGWIGQVQSFDLTEEQGVQETRYLGNLKRGYAKFTDGPEDVTGTLTYNPQDMRLVAQAIGSVVAVSSTGSNALVYATEFETDKCQSVWISGTSEDMGRPYSFAIEDSKQAPGTHANWIKTARGCSINTLTIEASEGEKVKVDLDVIAQTVEYSSGATSSVTANTNVEPYLWSDSILTLSGTVMNTCKDWSLEISNNLEAPHYVNGSKVIGNIMPLNRDYTLSVTADLENPTGEVFYKIYKAGTNFNADITLDKTKATGDNGSQYAVFGMSGCVITEMDAPSEVEGINEVTMTIRPQYLTGSFLDSTDYVGSYNPW